MSSKGQLTTNAIPHINSSLDTTSADRFEGESENMGRRLNASAPSFTPSPGALPHSTSTTRSGSLAASSSPQVSQARYSRPSSSMERNSRTASHAVSQRSGISSNTRNGRHDKRSGGTGSGRSRGGAERGNGRSSPACGASDEAHDALNSDQNHRRGGAGRDEKSSSVMGENERKNSHGSHGSGGDGRRQRVSSEGGSETTPDEESSQGPGAKKQYVRGAGGAKGRRRPAGGGNANHLLNFQFQPVQSHQGSGNSEGSRSKWKNAGGRAGAPVRGPMSKEQFLQANFHFLLHWNTPVTGGGDCLGLQDAFFDPDVLVDWDSVDTVRLSRKSMRRSLAPPGHQKSFVSMSPEEVCRPALESMEQEGKHMNTGDDTNVVWGSAKCQSRKVKQLAKECPSAQTRSGTEGDATEDPEDAADGDWRCSICLQTPRVPRITKCGHGPFCLVCILRHLRGQPAARCPLCFDLMHRDRLRRVTCGEVVPYVPGGYGSLLLLHRNRTSLVPTVVGRQDDAAGGAGDRGASSTPKDVSTGGGYTEACPLEGDSSERFSRLVRAKPSTLHGFADAEASGLRRFRQECLACGETEWIPYITQAQELVSVLLERFPSTSTCPKEKDSETKGLDGNTSVGSMPEQCRGDKSSEVRAVMPKGSTEKIGFCSDTSGAGGGTGETRTRHEANDVSRGACDVSRDVRGDDDTACDGNFNEARPEACKDGPVGEEKEGDGGSPTVDSGVGSAPTIPGDFKFFQSADGQRAFLHPLDMRQLLDEADQGLPLPERLDAEVLEVETVKLTPELRRRLPFLGHLPIHCDISFVELDMRGLVSESTVKKYQEETEKRQRKRRARAAQEARVKAAEKRAEEERAATIAAMRAFTVDLEGPKPGDIESVSPTPQVATPALETNGSAQGVGGPGTGPEVGQDDSGSHGTSGEDGRGALSSVPSGQAPANLPSSDDGARWSFARITAMNGHFPSLQSAGPTAQSVTPASSRSATSGGGDRAAGGTGAWGAPAAALESSTAGGAWGVPRRGSHTTGSGSGMNSAMDDPAREGVAVGDAVEVPSTNSGKKKGKKGKAVSLFSNAGVRGGR